jgi:hypothetical protein
VDRGPHTLQSYRMISAAAILVTNVDGNEPERASVVTCDLHGLRLRISSDNDVFVPFANLVLVCVRPPLGRSTYLVIRPSSGRLSAEARRQYPGASRDEETRRRLGIQAVVTRPGAILGFRQIFHATRAVKATAATSESLSRRKGIHLGRR